jgi:hypothetical protein
MWLTAPKRQLLSSPARLHCLDQPPTQGMQRDGANGLMGIKNGVNPKLLSLCMGHARIQMTEHYIAEAGLNVQEQQAAWQVVHGQIVRRIAARTA